MSYVVTCACGQPLAVEASAAGTSVPCPCGQAVEVPRLSVLKSRAVEIPEERPTQERTPGDWTVLIVIVAMIFLFRVAGGVLVFGEIHPLAALGFVVVTAGDLWLIGVMIRSTGFKVILLSAFIPIIVWIFIVIRFDIAKWPLVVLGIGLIMMIVGLVLAK